MNKPDKALGVLRSFVGRLARAAIIVSPVSLSIERQVSHSTARTAGGAGYDRVQPEMRLSSSAHVWRLLAPRFTFPKPRLAPAPPVRQPAVISCRHRRLPDVKPSMVTGALLNPSTLGVQVSRPSVTGVDQSVTIKAAVAHTTQRRWPGVRAPDTSVPKREVCPKDRANTQIYRPRAPLWTTGYPRLSDQPSLYGPAPAK